MFTLKNLSAGYIHTHIIKNLSLTIHDSSLISLIGPNGSGKTTLLRVLAGLLNYSGSVCLNASEIHSIPRKALSRSVAFAMSAGNFHPSSAFSVHEVIAMSRLHYMGMFSRLSHYDNDIISHSADMRRVERHCVLWRV